FIWNKDFFFSNQALSLKLPFLETYHAPELENAIYFLAFFLSGFIIAYFFSLSDRFKSKKKIKNLNAAAAAQQTESSTIKSELETLKGGSPGSAEAHKSQSEEGAVGDP
ncbi:MAG: LapA family protein, partial [Deltaproteobacteria bacterium]|nr:LapA family protein [Deltaproteobacteria bacterium]